jgi:hypothetical protein
VPYKSAALARDGAATKAFMICRNFSANDGMYPGQRPGSGGMVQGLPVAIGEGRAATSASSSTRSCRNSLAGSEVSASDGSGGSSGGESPRSFESGYAETQMNPLGAMPRPVSMVGPGPTSSQPGGGRHQSRRTGGQRGYHRSHMTPSAPPSAMMGGEYVCLCRRGAVRAYGRCEWCLSECGWNAYVS